MAETISINNGPDDVLPFPRQPFLEKEDDRDQRLQEFLLQALNAAVKVLNARLMILIALLGAVIMWGFIAIDPNVLKIICGACYSLGVLLPVLFSFSKRS